MDWLRSVLIVAILGVVGAIVIKYQSFESPLAQNQSVSTNNFDQNSFESAPVEPVAQQDGDVPMVQAQPTTPVISSSSSQFVTVETDVLRARINLSGGDIEDLDLLDHKLDIDRDDPLPLLMNAPEHVYVSQSGLVGRDGLDKQGQRANFSASQTNYSLSGEVLNVDLTTLTDTGVSITKRFIFNAGSHAVTVSYLIDNQSATEWQGAMYGYIKRDGRSPLIDSDGAMVPFLGMATTNNEENYYKLDFDDLDDESYRANITGGWISMVQHYYISAWVPNAEDNNLFYAEKLRSGFYRMGFTSENVTVPAGAQGELSAVFYAGPKDQDILEGLAKYLDLTVDYGWLWWIAKPLFWALSFFYGLIGNWGFAIIALTILIKGLFYYPSAISYRSMAAMRKFSPRIQELRERFGDDRQKLQQEMMKLYKEEKINPMAGCLPILLQMPVFIALYWMLAESVELRHAPFILWITDLSVKDPYFVLPIAMGIVMYLQQKLNPTPPDPMQAKIMQMMPIIFTFFFMFFPAGLVLYWLFNSLISMIQQLFIYRGLEKADAKKK